MPATPEKRPQEEAPQHDFNEVHAETRSSEHLDISDLYPVRLKITADLGSSTMLVRQILDLSKGAVVQLEKLAGEMSDVYVNELPLAKGEIVVIGDSLHIRIAEIVGAEEKSEDREDEEEDVEEEEV
jgi:flagellar motor switch protein FliN/FliY